MSLRRWMELNDVSRQDVANALGITKGHLSTLVNANRQATEVQCQRAQTIMNGGLVPEPGEAKVAKPRPKSNQRGFGKDNGQQSAAGKKKFDKLRPMTEFETKFVTDVAKAWIDANKNADKNDLVEIVRALSIGIRS